MSFSRGEARELGGLRDLAPDRQARTASVRELFGPRKNVDYAAQTLKAGEAA